MDEQNQLPAEPGTTATADPSSPSFTPEEADRDALIAAIEQSDAPACERWLDEVDAGELVHALSALSDEQRAKLLGLLGPESASDVISRLPELQALGALESVEAHVAAGIIGELDSDERAGLIRALDDDNAHAILGAMDPELARGIRTLAAYDEDSAGGLMLTEYLAFDEAATVREVLADIEANAEEYANYNIQYSYVIDTQGKLKGVLPLRNMLLARRSAAVSGIMIAYPIRVTDTATMDDVRAVFNEYAFMGLPVVDADDVLLGVIEASDVAQADAEQADDLYRQSQGIVGGEELRSMPLLLRSRRRLAWLSANIVLNIMAASIIALHQDTLEAVIALAVFLPIISDMSGCSGNQAVAVTMRELTLGVTKPRDALRVLVKESLLGLINGLALGTLIGAVAFAWKGNLFLSLVVGGSLAINTVVAVCIGGLIPLLLKKMKADPALASGPILTTVTDMCGFFIVLTFASMVLSQLT